MTVFWILWFINVGLFALYMIRSWVHDRLYSVEEYLFDTSDDNNEKITCLAYMEHHEKISNSSFALGVYFGVMSLVSIIIVYFLK